MTKTKKIWFNGKFIDWDKTKVHVLNPGLHYGGAVFEGIRAYKANKGPAVFRLDDHLKRLFSSAKFLEIKIPFSIKELKNAVIQTIKVNKIEECYIRPIAFFSYGKMSLNTKESQVDVVIALWPWEAYLGEEPVKVKISKYIRLHPQSCPMEAKISGYYVNSILATLEAQKLGFDEALLLDYQGYIAEGAGENIFMVKKGKIYTPSLGTILSGITRASVIEIAKDLGIPVIEKKIKPEEIKKADEAFFTGTAVEVAPIGKIDNVLINNGKIGEITKKIREIFYQIVRGENKKYLKWLTFVNR